MGAPLCAPASHDSREFLSSTSPDIDFQLTPPLGLPPDRPSICKSLSGLRGLLDLRVTTIVIGVGMLSDLSGRKYLLTNGSLSVPSTDETGHWLGAPVTRSRFHAFAAEFTHRSSLGRISVDLRESHEHDGKWSFHCGITRWSP